MCRPPQPSVPSYLVPSPGRSVTQREVFTRALANFRVSDPRYGAANKDVSCRHSAMDGAYVGNPAPPLGAYTVSLLCVVGTERCVTQVPYILNVWFPIRLITERLLIQRSVARRGLK